MHGVIDDSWSKAAQVPVLFDFTFLKNGEPTTVYIAQDSTGLDLAFDAKQSETITATQRTNGGGVMNDDTVGVVLWPQGSQGFQYQFFANPLGARYQSSSENSAYAPDWTAAGKRTASGYTVTMHIPFAIMRSGGSKTWRAQFERMIVANNTMQVWEHVAGQTGAQDPAYAGTLTGIGAQSSAAARPAPRLQLYGLGELTTPANGGDTSRVGLDASVPVTPTSSFVATLHPDYSNVEVDQQTISPAVFARQYFEVRPFFTQVGSSFNGHFFCLNCPQTLYTPAIPIFREGYAYEGTQGPLSFAAFDAIGHARADDAQVLTYNRESTFSADMVTFQRVNVNVPGFSDTTDSLSTGVTDQHSHLGVGFNAGSDRGTAVTDSAQAQYREYSAGYAGKNTQVFFDRQDIGSQFAPADGYVQANDIHGYVGTLSQTLNFSTTSLLHDIQLFTFDGRYRNQQGRTNLTYAVGQVNFDFKDLLSIHLNAGTQGAQIYDGEFLPFSQNGVYVSYKGGTSTPTSVNYTNGLYYHGHLVSWDYLTTLPIARALNLTFEVDRNDYTSPLASEPHAEQWLDRASLDWQFSRVASVDFGVRRIVGRNLPNAYLPPDPAITPFNPLGTIDGFYPFDYVNAGNVTAALHFLAAHNEFYAVYGDPNSLSTKPALFLKWIRYIGAEKGT